MSITGCQCGFGLRNGYGPGGAVRDIYPGWQTEEAIKLHPEYGILDNFSLFLAHVKNIQENDGKIVFEENMRRKLKRMAV